MTDDCLLQALERYYDTVPRAAADAESVGPFTLFVAREGWPYYARPRLGSDATYTASDVLAVLARQRELDVPRSLEWVHQTTPSLLAAAKSVGLSVEECALLVLEEALSPPVVDDVTVRMLDPTDPGFATARSAVDAGFSNRDKLRLERVADAIAARAEAGLLRIAGAFDDDGHAVGGGSHSPRDGVTELTGIAVLPSWRRRGVGAALTAALTRDAMAGGATTVFLSAASESVARIYEGVGFVRVGTACIVSGHE
ncbi:MAG TPA: GNAT family N-acetyltransferase [Nocardioidaceae bacterium]|nr:GNAT family N-acetyltransferase [Nocardioidaceae bacterium]